MQEFNNPPPPPPPQKYSSSKPWIIGIIVVAVLALGSIIGVLAYEANSASSPASSTDTGTTSATLSAQDVQATGTADAKLPQACLTYGQKNCVGDTPPPGTPTAVPTTNATVSGACGSACGTTQQWRTTHTYTGSGIKKTEIFTVPDDWKIVWKCDPASFYGSQYNVQVYVYNSDGSIADVAINDICSSSNTHGETEEHQGGSIYLDINSEGSWTIQVQEPQ